MESFKEEKQSYGGLILVAIVLLFAWFVFFYLPSKTSNLLYDVKDRDVVTKQAYTYLYGKYSMNEKDIKEIKNGLYGKESQCWNDTCGDNQLEFEYNGNTCIVFFDRGKELFTDNCQYNEISSGIKEYVKNKISYAEDITITNLDLLLYFENQKYHGDIISYLNSIIDNNYVTVDFLIKTNSSEEAEKYNINMINLIKELRKIKISSYEVTIGPQKDNVGKSYFYHYIVNDSYVIIDNRINDYEKTCKLDSFINGTCY